MILSGLLLSPARRRPDTVSAFRRRASSLRPILERLEDRVVLSRATALATAHPAQVQALATTSPRQLSVPIALNKIDVTSLVRDAAGATTFSGTATGTVLGQTFTTPLSGSITSSGNARANPVLRLDLQPVGLNLVGLGLKTSGIGLSISPQRGGGPLGRQVQAGLKGLLGNAGAGSSPEAAATLNTLVNDPQFLGAINRSLSQARPAVDSFSPAQGTDAATLDLSVGRTRLDTRGLSLRPGGSQSGPITVNLTGTRDGGLFGSLVSEIPGGGTGRALTRQINGVLKQISATPVPTLDQIATSTLLPTLPKLDPAPTPVPTVDPSAAGTVPATVAATAATSTTAATTSPTGTATATGSTLITIDLEPLDVKLLGLEVKTSKIVVTVSAQPGSGKLLGNLLTTVSSLINLQGVNNALNNVLANVVTLANAATLNVSGVGTGGPLATSTTTADVSVLTAHIAPVHLDLLGAVVDTSPIDLSITAHPGQGQVLGNVIAGLSNLLNTLPKNGKLDIPFVTGQIHTLNDQLAALTPSIAPSPSPVHTVPAGTTNVLSLNVAPINLNLLGLVLQTDQIQVNADAQSGSGRLLGNLLTDLLNTLNGTPDNMAALNAEVNNLLAKVVGVLNATTLALPANALGSLSQTLQTLALPNLVNTSGTPATAPVLNLDIASASGTTAPPIDVDLLGLVVTTSDVHVRLVARTGEGQILGNLVYNVSHLLDPGGALGLLPILQSLGL